MLFCTIPSIEIRFPNLSLFWLSKWVPCRHHRLYMSDPKVNAPPCSYLLPPAPSEQCESKRMYVFSTWLGKLSPPSPSIHLSPLRSCPAASFPWRFHTTPKPKYIILSTASPYRLVRILRWSSTICPELQPGLCMLVSPFLWKPPRGRNYAPLTHHHPEHKLLHRADAIMVHWDFRTAIIVSTQSC